jgi:hypothetical protein
VRVEQYAKDMGDEGYLHQFWTFDDRHQHGVVLNPGENTELAGYPAGFRFSPDSQWLVRMQKLGSGAPWIEAWRRVCDLKTAVFSVPPAFAEHNAKAFKTPRPGRK